MPYADPEKRRQYYRDYHKKRAEERALQQKLNFDKKRAKRRKQMEKRNRAAGHEPRPKGPLAQPEVNVPAVRRWRWLNGRIYFSTRRGFEVEELEAIVATVKEALAKAKRQRK